MGSSSGNVAGFVVAMAAAVLSPLFACADPHRIEVKPGENLLAVRDKVRALPEDVRKNGVEIVLLPGDHVLSDTLLLDDKDGGLSAESPVKWRGEKGARVIGGVRLDASRFRPVEDQEVLKKIPEEARGKVVVADLSADIPGELKAFPDQFSGEYPTPIVFANHAFATPARWPNEGYARFSRQIDKGTIDAKRRSLYYGGAFVFDDQRAARWDFASGVWLNGYWTHDWDNASVRAASWGNEGETNCVMRLAGGVPYGVMSGTWGLKERRFYAFNMIEELDAPGEWWVDRKRKLVYIVPPKGTLSDSDEIVVSFARRPFVKCDGALSHIAFEGVAFEYSAGDGLRLNGTDIHVRNCRVSCCGASGVVIYGNGNSVSGCEIAQMGQCGVEVQGGDRKSLAPAGTSVDGNDIHGFGIVRRTYAPGIAVGGCGISVRRNKIYDAPHSAVIYGGNEHLFESNEVYHVMLETGDAGAFYTGRDWTTEGNVLRYNFLHDLGPGTAGEQVGSDTAVSGENTMGFYFDDCDCGDAVYGNTFHRIARGIMIGGGREHPVSGNVFSCCNIGLSIDCRGMTWKNWNTPGGGWNLEEKAQKFDYTNGVWAAKYPLLAKIMQDHPREPLYNPITGNVFVGCRETLRLDNVAPLERMAPISNNVVVATGGALPKIDPRIAGGFRTVEGTADLEEARRLAAGMLDLPAAFVAGCRKGWSLSDMQAKCDQTITMPVVSFGQELTDVNMPPHLILLEASIADEGGKPRKVPRFSVNGTAVETDGCTEGSSDCFYSCVGARVTGAIKHDPAACDDKVVAIRADAGCKHESVATLINAASHAAITKVFLLANRNVASERKTEELFFRVIRPCPCCGWLHDEDAFLYEDEEALEEIEPPPGMEPSIKTYVNAVSHESPKLRGKEQIDEQLAPAMKMRLDIGPSGIIIQGGRRTTLDKLDARFEEQAKDPVLSGKGVFICCAMNSEHKTLVEVLSILYKHGFKRYYIFSM